ncbi:MAG: sulfatase, partial [Planctomycetota bacterium]
MGWSLGMAGGDSAVAAPPHLVVYLSDDLGRLETSIHGSPDVRTPTLDRLAASGMTFDRAYVASPSCCPNRYSLLTGLMPARHGAHPNHSQPKEGTKYLLPILKSLGYQIASFGKVAHGRRKMEGADDNTPAPRNLFKNVQQYLETKWQGGPLCLLVGDRRPHVAWTKEMEYDPEAVRLPKHFIDTPETRRHWSRYLTDITGMDREMGQVHELVQAKLGENSVFLFSSDHGGQWPFGKWNLYDSGTRVPLVVTWPGVIQPGTRTDAMVSWVDLIPTLIDLAGGDVPKDIDGLSFAGVLRGQANRHREQIFTTHTGDGNMNVFPMRSVTDGRWKYIVNLCPEAYHTNHSDRLRKDGAGAYWDSWDAAAKTDPAAAKIVDAYYRRPAEELFDLSRDPTEQANLIESKQTADIRDTMKQRLNEWIDQQGDDLQPHREPHSIDQPLPDLKSPAR